MQSSNAQPSLNNTPTSLQQSTSGFNHAPPTQGTPSKVTSDHQRVPSKPSESWETAYLFAFIYKFTSLCHTLKIGLRLQTVQEFERILETDTRIPQSESSEQIDSNISDAKEILTEILTTFHENLKTVNLNSWSKWLKSFVEEIVKHETQKPSLSNLKWPQNYISTRPNGFWDLDWLEKVHLLRILVDHQLTYSIKIRSIIDENYEKASNKTTKQQATSATSNKTATQNKLLIKPLGLDRNLKTWWQIDGSHRIYSSGNPYKSDCTWTVLSSTPSEFAEITSKLSVDPETIPQQQEPDSIQNESSSGSKNKKVTVPTMFSSKNRKKKYVPQDLTLQLEWKLSKAITETALSNIEAGEKKVQQLLLERERIEEREIRKQRKIALAKSRVTLTRETPGFGVRSRLRTQVTKPDYVVDSEEIDRRLERVLRESAGPTNESSDSGRKGKATKRKRKGKMSETHDSNSDGSDYQTGSLGETNEADDTEEIDDGGEDDRPARKRASGTKKAISTVQGERRSMRVRTKEMEVEQEPKPTVTEEEQPQPPKWSRSKPPSPPISDSVDNPCGDPAKTNGSVWSREKLIDASGNDKNGSTGEKSEVGQEAKGTETNALSALQARLATIGGADDDDDEESSESRPQKEIISTDNQNGGELSQLDTIFDQSITPANGTTENDSHP